MLSAVIILLDYLDLSKFAIMVVQNPIILVSLTSLILLFRFIVWLYRFIPTFKRMFRRTENFLNRYENSDPSVKTESPFKGGSKRKFSTGVKPVNPRGIGRKSNNLQKTSPSLLETIRSKFRVGSKVAHRYKPREVRRQGYPRESEEPVTTSRGEAW
jgi:hypothetical protein